MICVREIGIATVALAAVVFLCPDPAAGQDLGRLLPEAEAEAGDGDGDGDGDGRGVSLPEGGGGAAVDGGDEVLLERLDRIELVGDLTVAGERELRAGIAESEGEVLTTGGLVAVMDLIVAHYEARGFPVVEVLVPEQEISDGVVRIEVVEGAVGDVSMVGGAQLGRPSIGVRSGELLTMGGLQGELDWLNRNRFADARLTVAAGDALAEADLLFQLSDERPLRVFGGFDNAGVEVVGEERFSAGFEWGNAWGLGHRMIYQATLGADVDAFRGHALDYRVPLPWQHELALLGAIVESEVVLDGGVETAGTSWLVGARYTVPLKRWGNWRHEVSAGFDFKSTDNNLEFGGVEVFATAAELAHLVGRYSATLEKPGRRTAVIGDVVYSPGDVTGANSDEAFRGIRGDAVSDYSYFRGQVQHARRIFGGASLLLRVGGQWSDAPLLPSEQLSLGGHDRVRGYEEREGLGDKGYWGALEVRVPVVRENLQVLGFLDYGLSSMEGGSGSRELLSAGSGLRYRLGEHLSVRLDHGWQLDGGGSHTHFGLQVEF